MLEKKEYKFEQLNIDIKQDESGPMIIMTSVFMLWGFLTIMNGNLSGKIKTVLDLNNSQKDLLSYVFFAGYFVGGSLFYLTSRYIFDPFKRFGYKKMLIFGLLITAIGCFMFYPASTLANDATINQAQKFYFFLTTMLVLAAGFTILQVTANTYVIFMGDMDTAAARINLSQGFNSLGSYLAPLISTLLFVESGLADNVSIIKATYLTLGLAVLLLAFLFSISVLPDINVYKGKEKTKRVRNEKQLLLGALAIFLYVGGEVAIGDHLGDYLQLDTIANFDEVTAKKYTALYWGGAMAGRFAGATFLSRIEKRTRTSILILLTILCYLLGLAITGDSFFSLIFTGLFLINLAAFKFGTGRSAKTLGIFAACVIGFIGISILNDGQISMWSLIIIGMFNSIMFPNIFRLGISNLNQKTSIGASLLVLSIVGGALIPLLQNLVITDLHISLQYSFVVPAICYLFISYYGFSTFRKNG